MDITIFDLSLKMFQTITDYLTEAWCDFIVDRGMNTVSVKLSKYTKFLTTGNGIVIVYHGRSVLVARSEYYYIKIE